MIHNKLFALLVLILGLIACSRMPFMGAQKVIGGAVYVERWYLKTKYKKQNVPEGTAFYGEAAQKIKDRFIVKYYQADNYGSKKEIPLEHMWKVRHNGKRYNKQDDDNLFYYQWDATRGYQKVWLNESRPISLRIVMP